MEIYGPTQRRFLPTHAEPLVTITIDIIHITFRRIGNLLNYDDRQ
jgi:hypothetical protein